MPTWSICKKKTKQFLGRIAGYDKRKVELRFWNNRMNKYVREYQRNHPESRKEKDDVRGKAAASSDIPRQARYLKLLELDSKTFEGKRVLDIGCGPFPTALCFLNCEIYGLDPLIADYARIGYLMTGHGRYQFIGAAAEKIPLANGAIEAVISVNSIDHVDDLKSASEEIRRVLRQDGLFRMHVNYHSKTIAEPQVLSDEVFRSLFSWVPNLRKISESGPLSSEDVDNHALWSNF